MSLVDKIKQSASFKSNYTDCCVITTDISYLYTYNTFRILALICHIEIYPKITDDNNYW